LAWVVYYTASSLNGLLADENNSLDWLFSVEQDADPNEGDFSGKAAVPRP